MRTKLCRQTDNEINNILGQSDPYYLTPTNAPLTSNACTETALFRGDVTVATVLTVWSQNFIRSQDGLRPNISRTTVFGRQPACREEQAMTTKANSSSSSSSHHLHAIVLGSVLLISTTNALNPSGKVVYEFC